MTKTDKVRFHLQSGKTISSMEAFQMFNATRLSAIIFELRRKGYVIENIHKVSVDKEGNKSYYDDFKLVSAPDETSNS